jgi:branched-chain amino acid transport system substrate-binding protein
MRWGSRHLIAIASLLILGILVPTTTAAAQATGPITVGVLAPLTGPFATFARDIVDGAQLYHDEVSGQMGGRKLQLVVEDYQARPDVALTKIRKLVERDRAQAVVGIVLSAAALAVKDYVNAQKVPLLISGFATAEVLTLQPTPYVFRLTFTASMTGGPGAQWTYRSLKARRASIIASDSVGPIENLIRWERGFEEAERCAARAQQSPVAMRGAFGASSRA